MIFWDKWIMEMLPVRLRTVRLFSLLKVLLSPVTALYEKFLSWRIRMRLKASGTPQACILKRLAFDELGIAIDIEEGDGKPVDFIIKTSFTDTDKERQLFALIDKYKLAGKSYAYSNKAITFDCEWSRYVCEVMTANNILITYYWIEDREWGYIVHKLTVQADKPVQSDMSIELTVRLPTGGEGTMQTVNLNLNRGQSYYEMETWVIDKVISAVPHPTFDNSYAYNLLTKDIYE